LKPDANNRATTKDILRHDWLAHGPVLSIRLNSTTTTSSSLSLTEQQSSLNDYEKIHLRTITPVETSLSPNNSLVELELNTSSFFDTTRLRDTTTVNKEQQRRNRVSAIPISTRYLSSNNIKTNSSTTRPTYRRPVSLSLDDQPSQKQSITTRHSQRTVSPITTTTTTTYGSNDRFHSPHQYTLALSPESTTTTTTTSSPRYIFSSDLDSTLKDLKCKEIYKYTPPTTTVAPSVFTTSAIKFAPVPTRRISPSRDQDTNSARDDSINNTASSTTTTTNNNNRHSLLTSLELPTAYKHRLLDDNNNLVPLKVSE